MQQNLEFISTLMSNLCNQQCDMLNTEFTILLHGRVQFSSSEFGSSVAAPLQHNYQICQHVQNTHKKSYIANMKLIKTMIITDI